MNFKEKILKYLERAKQRSEEVPQWSKDLTEFRRLEFTEAKLRCEKQEEAYEYWFCTCGFH